MPATLGTDILWARRASQSYQRHFGRRGSIFVIADPGRDAGDAADADVLGNMAARRTEALEGLP